MYESPLQTNLSSSILAIDSDAMMTMKVSRYRFA